MDITPVFYIKNIPIYGNLILGPMDGISTQPFRALTREFGSAISYTEFISAIDAIHGSPHLGKQIAFSAEERPVAFQLLDNDPDRLLKAAINLLPHHPDFIDINLGCPARPVSGRGAGAGLLCSTDKIAQIFQLLTKHLSIPVTAKIRLGWDAATKNYLEVARIIEDNGGSLIAVHGRTREQGYDGHADWDAIAEIKARASIPVIANGDVCTVADIDRIKAHTQCDGVMIARAALGNPWIFSRIDRDQVSPEQVLDVMKNHLHRMVTFYGPELGLVLFRKHTVTYLKPYGFPRETRLKLVTCTDLAEFVNILDNLDFITLAQVPA